MNLNVLVAEPLGEDWISIAKALRRLLPSASLLRTRDGEQALRFTFQIGLLTADPQVPGLVLLSAELPVVSTESVLAQLRQDPRTRCTAVLVLWKDPGNARIEAFRAGEWLFEIPGSVAIEAQVAEALRRLYSGRLGRRPAAHSSV
jgi:CheY-like chemotaxis protein